MLLLTASLSVLVACQSALEPAHPPLNELTGSTDVFPKRNQFTPLDQLTQFTGSVHISHQGLATIKAKVFADGQHQFDFFLFRETPQAVLREGRIAQARVTIARDAQQHMLGLVIDDLTTDKRFVLRSAPAQATARLKLPKMVGPLYLLQGQGSAIGQSGVRWEDQ